MPEWYAQLSAYHHEFLPTQFTFTHSGPVAVGDKIYTRSTSHLYCIGSSLAVSDEKEIAAIRAMTTIAELTPKLDSTSPALRQEAITRISTLGEAAKPAVEKLTAIVNNDAFGAVRAAAVLALNAIDPAGKPGTAALNSKVGTTFNEWTFDTEVAETLTALGETVGLPMVASLLTNKDPKIIGSAALAMSKAGWSSDASRDALLKAERLNPRHVSTALSTNWGDDPLVITAHRTMLLAMRGGRETAWTIFAHLLRVTPKAERTAFIIKVANGQSDVVDNALKELSALKPQPAEALDIYLAKGAANSTTALNILIGILASDAPAATRCRVAEAMGKSKPEAWVLTPLQKASADPDPTVAAAAKAAVAALEAKGKSK